MTKISGLWYNESRASEEEKEEQRDLLTSAGIDPDDLEDMDDFEKHQTLEDAGLDPADFGL